MDQFHRGKTPKTQAGIPLDNLHSKILFLAYLHLAKIFALQLHCFQILTLSPFAPVVTPWTTSSGPPN